MTTIPCVAEVDPTLSQVFESDPILAAQLKDLTASVAAKLKASYKRDCYTAATVDCTNSDSLVIEQIRADLDAAGWTSELNSAGKFYILWIHRKFAVCK